MSLQELSRQTLADQAAESILAFIYERELKPGEALPSAAVLAAQLGVSRPVIREALKTLEGQNTIEIINGKGAIIRPVGSQDLNTFFQRALGFDRRAIGELLEVRQGLEMQAARLTAQRRTPEDLDALAQVLERMRSHFFDVEAYTGDDLAFHLTIAAATHNTMMVHMIESLRDATWESMHRWHDQQRTLEEYTQVQQMHVRIYEAVQRGSPDEAAEAMSGHFDKAIFDLQHSG
ncbi:MAG: FadR/GntR family transcriptional regulator [Anaerolineae bacterium]